MSLLNDAESFAREALRGFVSSHEDVVSSVDGGVGRVAGIREGHVAVILGGGSGHFPAFAGWVGEGLGSAAAPGNIFASPSESQVLRVARAAENGAGALFLPINYAGDILHFSAAAERLRSEGYVAQLVAITDDIASGPVDAPQGRRGIAGSLFVVKTVGAAAERGNSLETATRIANEANAATRSLGVAFSGCTLPGATRPLFEIPEGMMAVGLGIHGEPGLEQIRAGSASEVADVLIDGLFADRAPERGRRVAVIVNGLGGTKYDELFVVFERVHERLADAGMTIVAPVVGEQVTSLDMAGLSLSLAYLDEELEELWLAPARSASFVRGPIQTRGTPADATQENDDDAERGPTRRSADHDPLIIATRSKASAAAGRYVADRLTLAREVLTREQARLGEIDAVAGDGDHGIGMRRGVQAAVEAASAATERRAGVGTVLHCAGEAWSDVGGGTSGALWGTGLRAAGKVLGDEAAPNSTAIRTAVEAFRAAIEHRGGAEIGDKTMLDAIVPFTDVVISDPDEPLSSAWTRAAHAAEAAALGTAAHAARRGRSHIHGDRSVGTPDPGAISFALIADATIP